MAGDRKSRGNAVARARRRGLEVSAPASRRALRVALLCTLVLSPTACRTDRPEPSEAPAAPVAPVAPVAPDESTYAGVHPLPRIGEWTSDEELDPFGALVGEARVVGLGESVHRSRGFLEVKTRLIRYLIERHGFRAVALETEWVRAERVQAYLETCEGDPEAVVRDGIRETWHSQPVDRLVGWLCEYNTDHPDDPVGLFGFNVFQPWDDIPPIRAFATRFMAAEAEVADAALGQCEGATASDEEAWRSTFSGTVDAAQQQACTDAIDAVEAFVSDNEAELRRELSSEELERLQLHLVSLRGWQDYQYHQSLPPNPTGINSRDQAMATVFSTLWHRRFADTKVVISAHNLHLNRGSETIDTVFPPEAGTAYEGTIRMGNHLSSALGPDYVPVGLLCYRCGMADVWMSLVPDEIPVSTGNTIIEGLLHSLDEPALLLDLAAASGEGGVLEAQRPYGFVLALTPYMIGVYEAVPATLFRALIFLEQSQPLHLNLVH